MLLLLPAGWALPLPLWCCCCCFAAELLLLRVPPGSVALPFHVEAVLLLPLTGLLETGGGNREAAACAAAFVREMPIRWLGSCESSRCTWLKSPSVFLMRRDNSSSWPGSTLMGALKMGCPPESPPPRPARSARACRSRSRAASRSTLGAILLDIVSGPGPLSALSCWPNSQR